MDFYFWNTISAIFVTIILKIFVYQPFLEWKSTKEWCDADDELKEWLQLGISKDHPKAKELMLKEKETRKKLEKIHGFKILTSKGE